MELDQSNKESNKHYQQAVHNFKFFCEVHSKLPDVFYDWKITILFYTAIHLLRALMDNRGIKVDNSHIALRNAINPNKPSSISPVKPHCYSSYVYLYNASQDARYSGFLEPDRRKKYLLKKFLKSRNALSSIDSYMKSQSYPSLMPIQHEFDFKE